MKAPESRHLEAVRLIVAGGHHQGRCSSASGRDSVLAQALQQGHKILVITRREIEQLTDTGQLVRLLKQKRVQLAVSRTKFPGRQGGRAAC